jgi:hypothetical protein
MVSIFILAKFLASAGGEVVQEKYLSHSEAISEGAFIQGMVPSFLPKSATKIIAERNVDLDTLTVDFVFESDFDAFLVGKKKTSLPLPTRVLEKTSLSDIDINELQVFSNPGSDQVCASHLVIDMKMRRAVYIYNVAPHRIGCWDEE